MIITVNTAEAISELDAKVLLLLLGETGWSSYKEVPAKDVPAAKAPPEKKAPAKAAKKPEPEPDPAAEEPLEEEEPEEEPGEEPEDAEAMDDQALLELAVKKATELVSSGQAEVVRKALDHVGASRVRELSAKNVREFFKELP